MIVVGQRPRSDTHWRDNSNSQFQRPKDHHQYSTDLQPHPVAATDPQGNVVWRESYQPYGTRDQHQGDGQNSLWFTGKQEM